MLPTARISCTLKARLNESQQKELVDKSVKPVFIDLTDNAGGVLEPTNWRVCEL